MASVEIRRPFGGSVVATTSGTLVPRLSGQRLGGTPPPMYYTHILTVGAGVGIRYGCSRIANTNELQFGMGDEVRIPPGTSGNTRFAVSYVEKVAGNKRVFLTRDAVDWANNGLQ